MEHVIYCFQCGKQDHSSSAEFCGNCGFQLNSNQCSDELCVSNNGKKYYLPEDYCYCDTCGVKSTYFKNGWIKTQILGKASPFN